MVNDLNKFIGLLTIAEKEQSPSLKFELAIDIVNSYFRNYFYPTELHRLDNLIELSLDYYINSSLNDKKLEYKLLLFQAIIKTNLWYFDKTSKNLSKCKQLVHLFKSTIYEVHYFFRSGILHQIESRNRVALSEHEKAKSILEKMEGGFEKHTKLYLEILGNHFTCHFRLREYELAFKYYYDTVKLGLKYDVYEPLAKLNTNFYVRCYYAKAYKEASEAIAITRKISKKTNSETVKLHLAAIEVQEKFFENNISNIDKVLKKHKKTLTKSNLNYFIYFYLDSKIDVNLQKKKYKKAFKYCTKLCRLINYQKTKFIFDLLLYLCKICTHNKKYVPLISEMPEYSQFGVDYKLENLFRISIQYLPKHDKSEKVDLYNLIIQHYKKNGFNESGFDILTDCLDELHKISTESVENEMIQFKQKYDAIEKAKETNELLDKQKKLTQFFKEFAYTAAHDLKAPLKTITGFAQIIKKSYNDIPIENAQEYLNNILDTGKTMSKFINELIKYKNNNADCSKLVKISLEDIIKQVKINLYHDIENSNCSIKILSKDVVFSAKHTPLEILFQNFISNAIKYKRNGVKPVVEIDIEKKGKEIISVSDNGIGIPKEMQQKIFDPFFQIPNKQAIGSGIGLATCKKIVKSFGGKIWLESIVGKGSTFYFTLGV